MLRTLGKRAQKIDCKLSPHYVYGPYMARKKKREIAKSYNVEVNQDDRINAYKFVSREREKIPFMGLYP